MVKWMLAMVLGMLFILSGLVVNPTANAQSRPDEMDDEELLLDEEELPDVDIDEIEEFYQEFNPAVLEKLRKLQNDDSKQFEEALIRCWQEMMELKQLKQEDPEKFERIMKEHKKQKPQEKKQPSTKPSEKQRPGEKSRFPPQEGDDRPPQKMPQQEEIDPDEVMAFLKEFRPEMAEELAKLRKENPDVYKQAIQRQYFEIMHLRELKKNNPEQYEKIIQQQKLEEELRKLAEKYHRTKDEKEKESIKKQMRDMMAKTFEMMEQGKEQEIKRLEQEVNKLKEKMKKRQAEKDKIIEERLKQMTGEKEEWDW